MIFIKTLNLFFSASRFSIFHVSQDPKSAVESDSIGDGEFIYCPHPKASRPLTPDQHSDQSRDLLPLFDVVERWEVTACIQQGLPVLLQVRLNRGT